jgi:hypothetical protein
MELGNFLVVLQTLAIIVLVYFPTASITGYFQAWLAARLGDTTARSFGFQTLDPAVHTSAIGLFFYAFSLLIPGWGFLGGWGNRVPVSPGAADKSFGDLKKIVLFFIGSLAHGLLLLVSIFVVVTVSVFLPKLCLAYPIFLIIFHQYIVLNFLLTILYLFIGAAEFMFIEVFRDSEIVKKHGLLLFFVSILVTWIFVFPFLGKHLWSGVTKVCISLEVFLDWLKRLV